jgi:hypothetical protein
LIPVMDFFEVSLAEALIWIYSIVFYTHPMLKLRLQTGSFTYHMLACGHYLRRKSRLLPVKS